MAEPTTEAGSSRERFFIRDDVQAQLEREFPPAAPFPDNALVIRWDGPPPAWVRVGYKVFEQVEDTNEYRYLHDTSRRSCPCTVDAELGAGSSCFSCGHRDHGRIGCNG